MREQQMPEEVRHRPNQHRLYYVPEKVACACGWFVNIVLTSHTNKVIVVECMNMQCSHFEVQKKIPFPEIFWEEHR